MGRAVETVPRARTCPLAFFGHCPFGAPLHPRRRPRPLRAPLLAAPTATTPTMVSTAGAAAAAEAVAAAEVGHVVFLFVGPRHANTGPLVLGARMRQCHFDGLWVYYYYPYYV